MFLVAYADEGASLKPWYMEDIYVFNESMDIFLFVDYLAHYLSLVSWTLFVLE